MEQHAGSVARKIETREIRGTQGKTTTSIGLSPLPVTVANESLVRDPLLKITFFHIFPGGEKHI